MLDVDVAFADAVVMGAVLGPHQHRLALQLVYVVGADGVAGIHGDQVVDLDDVVDMVEAVALGDAPQHGFGGVAVFGGGLAQGLVGPAGGVHAGILSDGLQLVFSGQAHQRRFKVGQLGFAAGAHLRGVGQHAQGGVGPEVQQFGRNGYPHRSYLSFYLHRP